VENGEFAAFARRIVRAYARRVADGDVEALPELVALSANLEQSTKDAVLGLHRFGYSWAEIGARLGMTRQGVRQRWGVDRETGGETPTDAAPPVQLDLLRHLDSADGT
jgi:hypothetical protein